MGHREYIILIFFFYYPKCIPQSSIYIPNHLRFLIGENTVPPQKPKALSHASIPHQISIFFSPSLSIPCSLDLYFRRFLPSISPFPILIIFSGAVEFDSGSLLHCFRHWRFVLVSLFLNSIDYFIVVMTLGFGWFFLFVIALILLRVISIWFSG